MSEGEFFTTLAQRLSEPTAQLNQREEQLTDALRGLLKLVDDGDLVRYSDRDATAEQFIRRDMRIIGTLAKAKNALEGQP